MTSPPRILLPRFTFINGPAGSGKSSLAKALAFEDDNLWVEGFAEPIRAAIQATFFPDDGPMPARDYKDEMVKSAEFPFQTPTGPITFRQAMISFSEDWMKKKFGEDIFGRLAFSRCVEQEYFYDRFVFDDSGFTAEATPIITHASPENCLLIRLEREGKNFKGDSRGYITLPCKTITLLNDGTIADLLDKIALQLGGF